MVINHLEKLLVTSDAATILTEMEVQHPAAKLVVMAASAQQAEIGDGTNLVRSKGGGEERSGGEALCSALLSPPPPSAPTPAPPPCASPPPHLALPPLHPP